MMTTNEFIAKVNQLTGVYAKKHLDRDINRLLIDVFQSENDMCFAEIAVKKRALYMWTWPSTDIVPEKTTHELLNLIVEYRQGDE